MIIIDLHKEKEVRITVQHAPICTITLNYVNMILSPQTLQSLQLALKTADRNPGTPVTFTATLPK